MKNRRNTRAGVAAVELAFCLPFLMLLIVGIWEVGRMLEVQDLAANAVREGGRQAATGNKSLSQVKDAVVTYLVTNGIKKVTVKDVTVVNKTVAVRTDPATAEQLDRFQISVSISVDNIRWSWLNQLTNIKTLTASTEWYSMRDIPIDVATAIPLE